MLKKRAGQFMDLYWALVAEEQLAGITGGAMTRHAISIMRCGAPASCPARHGMFSEWAQDSGRPYYAESWEAPDVVLKIAHRWSERAPYEIRQRRMGLAVPGHDRPSLQIPFANRFRRLVTLHLVHAGFHHGIVYARGAPDAVTGSRSAARTAGAGSSSPARRNACLPCPTMRMERAS